MQLPRLYAIADKGSLPASKSIFEFVEDLIRGGVRILQYRNKLGSAREMLADARELKRIVLKSGERVRLIMNDRADLCVAAGFDGVHLGQDDLSVEGAHLICKPAMVIGVSTHNPAQVKIADQTSADYIAIGPVFQTSSKANPDPVIGLDGIQAARKLTRKPLVAIGGITRANCKQVIEAGADSVAVISELVSNPAQSAEYLLKLLT